MKHACEKISQLASDQLERKLSFSERLSMQFHFLMCGACKHYHQNLLKLHEALNVKRKAISEDASLPEDKRAHIEQTLRELPKHSE